MLKELGDRPTAYILIGLVLGLFLALGVLQFSSREFYSQRGAQQAQIQTASVRPKDDLPEGFWEKTRSDPITAYTLALVVFTGVPASVALVQVYFLRHADDTARVSAEAAGLSAMVARDSLKITQRARVRIIPNNLVLPTIGNIITIHSTITNIGLTEGDAIYQGSFTVLSDKMPKLPEMRWPPREHTILDLSPGAPNVCVAVCDDITLTAEQWGNLCNNKCKIFHIQKVVYIDVFGEEHTTCVGVTFENPGFRPMYIQDKTCNYWT